MDKFQEEHVGARLMDTDNKVWRVIKRLENGEYYLGVIDETAFVLSEAKSKTLDGLITEINFIEEVHIESIIKGIK